MDMAHTREDYVVAESIKAADHGGMNEGVYVVKSRHTNKKYIEKRLTASFVASGMARREVRAMSRCIGQATIIQLKYNDLSYHGYGYGSIFMQYCELGSLDGLISRYRRKGKHLGDEGFLWKVFWDIAVALCYLNTGVSTREISSYAEAGNSVRRKENWDRIYHRDIKPDNVFLTWNVQRDGGVYPTVVLGDFGCSISDYELSAGPTNKAGTPCFASPEFHTQSSSDVYSLGLVLHCLATMRNEPIRSLTKLETEPLQKRHGSTGLDRELRHCLSRDPDYRTHPGELPCLVFQSYKSWRKHRGEDGKRLPDWAFG